MSKLSTAMNQSSVNSSMSDDARTPRPAPLSDEYLANLQHQDAFSAATISPFLMPEIAAYATPHFPLSMLSTASLGLEYIHTMNWLYPCELSMPNAIFDMGGSAACTPSNAMSPNSDPASPPLLLSTSPALAQHVGKSRLTHECSFCQKLFPSRARLNSHILTHTGTAFYPSSMQIFNRASFSIYRRTSL
ncbi:hypothetical protein BC830DRAFT_741468 [Chytriomyces sp. MP71]|nr:hypothetical protein BC830DRAFT_741468 [Chytriomyces sp. MP71]